MEYGKIEILLEFNSQQAKALLDDNPTARSLLAQLPVTISFEDYSHSEKIAYFPIRLSCESISSGYQPVIGDITCYGPWGNIAIFYKNHCYSSGLIYIGRITTGLANLCSQDSIFEITITQNTN